MIRRVLSLSVLALVALLTSSSVSAQTWLWAARQGGACYDYYVYPYRIATDAQGNVYVTGYFYSYATFGTTIFYSYSGANADMFVAKYNAAGQLQWVHRRRDKL
jgi:hypothetical protein